MRRALARALALSVLPALALLATAPASAQDTPEVEREVIVEIDTLDSDGPIHVEVERDEDGRRIVIRRRAQDGEIDENVIRFRMPETDEDGVVRFFSGPDDEVIRFRAAEIAEQIQGLGDTSFAWFDGDGPGAALRLFDGGVSAETRERMRELQTEARALARQAREANGAERETLVDELDALLDELFEVRGQARQEEADRLRERARELMEEADEKEAALRERADRRRALIEARRAELLGEPASDW